MTYTVGKSAKKVFKKTIPKIIGTLGQEPPFIIVIRSLSAEELITDQELKHIKAKLSPAEKGDEITQKLLDKIEASDNPVQCLLTICDVFESEEVDNETLRKHGASMRSNFTSKKTLLSKPPTPSLIGTATPQATSSPPQPALIPSATKKPNEISKYMYMFRPT